MKRDTINFSIVLFLLFSLSTKKSGFAYTSRKKNNKQIESVLLWNLNRVFLKQVVAYMGIAVYWEIKGSHSSSSSSSWRTKKEIWPLHNLLPDNCIFSVWLRWAGARAARLKPSILTVFTTVFIPSTVVVFSIYIEIGNGTIAINKCIVCQMKHDQW